jgi:hypothetical protein
LRDAPLYREKNKPSLPTIPEEFYISPKELRRILTDEARINYIKYRLPKHRCIACSFAKWKMIQYTDSWSGRILDEYLTCMCNRVKWHEHSVNRLIVHCPHCQTSTFDGALRNNLSEEIGVKKLGKILELPPSIDKSLISPSGTEILITKAYIETDIHTQLGTVAKALMLNVKIGESGKEGYQMFSIPSDKPMSGSGARILKRFLPRITDTDQLNEATLKELVGKKVVVKNRMDKLYWYP